MQFDLTTLEPLQTKKLIESCSKITFQTHLSIIINGWKTAGIYNELEVNASRLPSIDRFEDIWFLFTTCESISNLCAIES